MDTHEIKQIKTNIDGTRRFEMNSERKPNQNLEVCTALGTVGTNDFNKYSTCTVYSHGNAPGKPEFIAFDVPFCKANHVGGTMNFLGPRKVGNGHNVGMSNTDFFSLKLINGKEKEEILKDDQLDKMNPMSTLFQLVPVFDHDRPEDWGSRPQAPKGREDLVEGIIDEWLCQKKFLLFANSSTLNYDVYTKKVDLAVALRHVDDWKTDWGVNLTPEQVAFVRRHSRYFIKIARVLFRKQEMCEQCGLIDKEVLSRCGGCKQTYYCSVQCQKQDWPNHKKECIILRSMRNKKEPKWEETGIKKIAAIVKNKSEELDVKNMHDIFSTSTA